MTNPQPDQPARADRRSLPYPGDEAITAARRRTHRAFAQLFTALGPEVTPCTTPRWTSTAGTAWPAPPSRSRPPLHGTWTRIRTSSPPSKLTAALEGSCTVLAILVVQTGQEPGPVVCGWRIERGWLHGMKAAAVQAAVRPCGGS
ncbi:hypothetical protein ACIQWL_44425 [Streptomyces mirabilis]|uniref:hypothetical protein n=1 Tax=Streptomyces mirabilis TaxID=68239 RepID=UPI000765C4F8